MVKCMILDKLLEKKDLLNYLSLRLEILHKIDLKQYPEQNRKYINERRHGRILEVQKLINVIKGKSDLIKDLSKRYYKSVTEPKIDKNEYVEISNGYYVDKKTIFERIDELKKQDNERLNRNKVDLSNFAAFWINIAYQSLEFYPPDKEKFEKHKAEHEKRMEKLRKELKGFSTISDETLHKRFTI